MEQIAGISNWKLTVRREPRGIAILRATTCDRDAALPEELWGLPVISLSRHALAPSAQPVSGEEVLVTCGQPAEETLWDNRGLRTLTLPKTLLRMEDYALLNCDHLRELRLYDGVAFWGGAVFMNCRALNRFHLIRVGQEQGDSLEYICSELSCDLDISIQGTDGQTARLLFPDFQEVYEENISAHHFQYWIHGGGYAYHHIFRQRKLSMKDYDALWHDYIHMEHEDETAIRLAWYRLRYPVELAEKAEEQYLDYLRERTADAVRWLLTQRDQSDLRFLLKRTEPDRETLAEACAIARENHASEALAILLEEQHRRFPAGAGKRFDL